MRRGLARVVRGSVVATASIRQMSSGGENLQPFHLAFPVHCLEAAREFYGEKMGCQEGRRASTWQDFSLYGHQIVAHLVNESYRATDYYNDVDADDVPVPHFGVALSVPAFHTLAQRLADQNVQFIIPPHLRFQGQPGEQWTMFFRDYSNNSLEFKAMTTPANLFARYDVDSI